MFFNSEQTYGAAYGRAVDVFAGSAGSPPLILGSVLPGGRSEFVMPFESTYAYMRESDGWRSMRIRLN